MTTVQIPDALVERLENIARSEQRSLEELVIEILDRYSSPTLILTAEQFVFMREHHEEMMRAIIAHKRAEISGDSTLEADAVIDRIVSSVGYKQHFGDMQWDEAIDRYEDTPGYDNRLWVELHEQLQRDLETGVILKAPLRKPAPKHE